MFILALMDTGQLENRFAIEARDGAKPSCLRRFLLPSWTHRKRMLRREAWVLVIGLYVALAFAYLWPHDFRNTSQGYVAVSLIVFMARVFMFHLGLLLAVVAVVSLRTRQWRLLAAAAPLILVTLGPAVWSFRPKGRPSASGEAITVTSVNLLMVNRDATGARRPSRFT